MAARNPESAVHQRKRVRFSGDDSSEPSMSDESALVATSTADDSTVASDPGSDMDSDMSESSEEPSSDSSSEGEDDSDVEMQEHQDRQGVVNLLANRGKKPVMKLDQQELGPDIRTFLKDFLPQLKAANEELELQKKAGTLRTLEMDDAEGATADQHIEMDLGLGVLEAKDPNADDSASDESEGSDTEGEGKEKDVLGKLMGRKNTKGPAVVEEVRETPQS